MNELRTALDGLRRERAGLERRMGDVDQAIADLARTLAVLDPEAPKVSEAPKEFTGAILRDAAAVVLQRAAGPMRTRDLCDALQAGGFPTQARDFYMVVYGGLKKMANFARTREGGWVYQEGAAPGSYVTAPAKAKGKAKGAER